ncbi:MAG: hypothetical protein ACLGHN_09265 [Bacteriovoracia bacterium]
MLKFLALTLLLFPPAYANENIPSQVKDLIDLGFSRGLKEVNEEQNPDKPRYRDKTGLVYLAPPGGWKPNSALYKNAKSSGIPSYFYRTVRDCKTNKVLDEQLIFTYNGYANYVGGSRYRAQCILDGSADTYYEETQERLKIN